MNHDGMDYNITSLWPFHDGMVMDSAELLKMASNRTQGVMGGGSANQGQELQLESIHSATGS